MIDLKNKYVYCVKCNSKQWQLIHHKRPKCICSNCGYNLPSVDFNISKIAKEYSNNS